MVVRYCADHAPMAMTGEIREMQGRAYLPNTYMSRGCLRKRALFLCVILWDLGHNELCPYGW